VSIGPYPQPEAQLELEGATHSPSGLPSSLARRSCHPATLPPPSPVFLLQLLAIVCINWWVRKSRIIDSYQHEQAFMELTVCVWFARPTVTRADSPRDEAATACAPSSPLTSYAPDVSPLTRCHRRFIPPRYG
jgi:hypothetical protein